MKDEYKITQLPTSDQRYTTVEDSTQSVNNWVDHLKDRLTSSSAVECAVTGIIRHSDDTVEVLHLGTVAQETDVIVTQRNTTWQHRIHESSREVFDELYCQIAPTFVESDDGGVISIGNSEDIHLVFKSDGLDSNFYNEPESDETQESGDGCDECN